MDNYKLQKTTIWSFPNRGNWSTHKGDYRGNWSPHIPRNLILKYTKENDLVLDCFLGSGTTLIECKLLNRNAIGLDINQKAIDISNSRLTFQSNNNSFQKTILSDSRNMEDIENESIDFICTHPPYADIIKYSDDISNDLSSLQTDEFLIEIKKVSDQLFRVIKPGKYCSYMIGDIRKKGSVIPLGFKSMEVFISSGFKLKEMIIKQQHNCAKTNYWENKNINFYLLAHEYIFVLYK